MNILSLKTRHLALLTLSLLFSYCPGPSIAGPTTDGMWVLHHFETITRPVAGAYTRSPGQLSDSGVTKVIQDPLKPYNVTTNPYVDRNWTIKAGEASMKCSQRSENYTTTWVMPSTVLSGESLSGAMNVQTSMSPNPMNTPEPVFTVTGFFHHGYLARSADGLPIVSVNPAQVTNDPASVAYEKYYYPVALGAVRGPAGFMAYNYGILNESSSLPFLSVDIRFGSVTFSKVVSYRAIYVWANKVELSSAGNVRLVSSIRNLYLDSWFAYEEDYAPKTWFAKFPTGVSAFNISGKYSGTDGRALSNGMITVAGASTETTFFSQGAGHDNGYDIFVTTGNRSGGIQSKRADVELFPRWESRIRVTIAKEGFETLDTEIDFSDYFYTHYFAGIAGVVRDSRGNPAGGAVMTFTPFFQGAWGSPKTLTTYSDGSFRASHRNYTFDQNTSGNELNLRIGVKTVNISSGIYSNTALPGKDIIEDYVLPGKAPAGEIRLVKAQALPHGNVNVSFLDGISHYVNFEIGIDWGGNDPGKVVFETTAGRKLTIPATGNRESALIDVGTDVGPAGKIYVQAIDASGEVKSKRRFLKTRVMPKVPFQDAMMLSMKKDVSGSFEYLSAIEKAYGFFKANMPGTECPSWMPYFGGKDLTLDFMPEVALKVTSAGVAEFGIGVNNPDKAGKKVDVNGKPIPPDTDKKVLAKMAAVEFKLQPFIRVIGNYSDSAGKWVWGGHAKIFGSAEVKKVFPFMVGSIPCFAAASFSLSANSAFGLKEFVPSKDEFEKYGDVRLIAALEGKVGAGVESLVAAEGFVKGSAEVQFDWPQDGNTSGFVNPDYHLRHREFAITLGGRAYALVWKWEREFKTWKWPGEEPSASKLASGLACGAVAALSMPGLGAPEPMDRGYLGNPGGGFNPRAGVPGLLGSTAFAGGARVSCLQASAFPFADPFLAATSARRFVAWLYDDPARSTLDRTVLRVSMRDDTAAAPAWTEPRPVSDDGTGDFHPVMAAFDDGNTFVAWEDLRAQYQEGTHTLDDMLAGMEISVCRAIGATLEWGPPTRLTDDSFMDRSPRISGPNSGNLMLTWVRNEQNHMTGLSVKPNKLMYSIWNGASWSAPAVAATVPYRLLSYTLAYDGTKAAAVLSCGTVDSPEAVDSATMADGDDPLKAVRDRELFSVSFSSGTWSGTARLTQDTLSDDNPQVAFDASGIPVLVWVREGSLTFVRNMDMTSPASVRKGEYSSNLAGARLASDPGGTLAVIWPGERSGTTDLQVLFHDPAENAWGNPRTLTADDETERSVSAAFTSAGTVSAVYHRNLYADGSTLPPGAPGEGMAPVLANSDVYILDYAMVRDLAIGSEGLSMTPEAALPGDAVTLRAKVENRGDFAARDAVVRFGQAGTRDSLGNFLDYAEIGRVTLQGLLLPGASVEASLAWTIPGGFEARNLVADADPDSAFETETARRSDNQSALAVMLPDLALLPAAWSETFPGILDITLNVVNSGSAPSRAAVVELRDTVAASLVGRAPIQALAAGQTAEATISWNINRLRAERARFSLEARVDPDNHIPELNEVNNIRAVNLDGELQAAAVWPESADYGLLPVGATHADRVFEIRNAGTAALTVHRAFIDGNDPHAFRLTFDGASGTIIQSGGSGMATVRFAPPGPGSYDALLAVETDDPAVPVVHAVLRGGMAPASSPVVSMTMLPPGVTVLAGATLELSQVRARVNCQDGSSFIASPVSPGAVQAPGLRSWVVTSGSGVMNGSVFGAPSVPETGTVAFYYGDGVNTASANLTVTVAPPPVTGVAAGVPANGFAIYSRGNGSGGADIWKVPFDGTGASALTASGSIDRSPAVSPDGTKVAFVSLRDGNAEIYSMNADGTGQTRLTGNTADEAWPFFSSDGSKIFFASSRDGNAEIYSMNADGTGQTRLTENDARDDQPCSSVDGGLVYFVSERDGNAEIYAMKPDGTGQVRLTRTVEAEASPVSSASGLYFSQGGVRRSGPMAKETAEFKPLSPDGAYVFQTRIPGVTLTGDFLAVENYKSTDGGYNYFSTLDLVRPHGQIAASIGGALLSGDRPAVWTPVPARTTELTGLEPGGPGTMTGPYPSFTLWFSGRVGRDSVEKSVILRKADLLYPGVPVKVRWEWGAMDSMATVRSLESFDPGSLAGLDLLPGALDASGVPVAGFGRTLAVQVRGGADGGRIAFASYNSYYKTYSLKGLIPSDAVDGEVGYGYAPASFDDFVQIIGPRILPCNGGFIFETNHFSATGTYIAEIYGLNLDGRGLRLLSDPTHNCHVTSVSDDGGWLLYTLYSDRKTGEYTYGRDLWLSPTAAPALGASAPAPGAIMVAGGAGSVDFGLFVPGTKLILCKRVNEDGTADCFTVDRSGTLVEELFKGVQSSSYPVLSGDGSKAYLPIGPSGSQRIWSVNLDGTAPIQLSSGDLGDHLMPVPYPDGSKVVFVSSVQEAGTYTSTVMEVGSDGSGQRVVAGGDASYSIPRMTPDGSAIAFNRVSESTDEWGFTTMVYQVCVATPGTAGFTVVTPTEYSCSLSGFAPGGRIFYLSPRKAGTSSVPVTGLYSIGPDGTGETLIAQQVSGLFIEPPATLPDSIDIAILTGLVVSPGSAVVRGGSSLDLSTVRAGLATSDGRTLPAGTVTWTIASGPGLITAGKFNAPLAGGMTVLRASASVGTLTFERDFQVSARPVPVDLTLPFNEAVLLAGRRINLEDLGVTLKLSDGRVQMVTPAWTRSLGGGTVEAGVFSAPSASEMAAEGTGESTATVLKASYTFEGITLERNLTILVHQGLSSISLVPPAVRVEAGRRLDLDGIGVMGRYGSATRPVPGVVWTLKSGGGTVEASTFTAPTASEIAAPAGATSATTVLTASYSFVEDPSAVPQVRTTHTADLVITVQTPVRPVIRGLVAVPGRFDSPSVVTGMSAQEGSAASRLAAAALGATVEASGPCRITWEAFDPDTPFGVRVFWSISSFDPALLEPWLAGTDPTVPATYGLRQVNAAPVIDSARSSAYMAGGLPWNPMALKDQQGIALQLFPSGTSAGSRSRPIFLYAVALDSSRSGTSAGGQIVRALAPLVLTIPQDTGSAPEIGFPDLAPSSPAIQADGGLLAVRFMVSDDSGGAVSVYLFHAAQKDIRRAVPCLGSDGLPLGGTFQSVTAALVGMTPGGPGTHTLTWDTSSAPSGDRYLLALAGDGTGEPRPSWSDGTVSISRELSGNTAPTVEWTAPSPENPLRNISTSAELGLRISDGEGDTLVIDILANGVNAENEGIFTVASGITVENTASPADIVIPFDASGLRRGPCYLLARVRETGRAGLEGLAPIRAWSMVPVFVDPGAGISDLVAGPFRPDPADAAKFAVDIAFRTGAIATGRVVFGPADLPGTTVQGSSGKGHFITLAGLLPGTSYGFLAEAEFGDGTMSAMDNGGALYCLDTPSTPAAPAASAWVSGRVADSDGLALQGVQARVFAVRNSGEAGEIVTFPVMTVTGADGSWSVDIGSAIDPATGAPLDPAIGEADTLRVELVAPEGMRRFVDRVPLTGIGAATSSSLALARDELGAAIPLGMNSEVLEHILPVLAGFNLVAAPIETTAPLTARGVLDLCGEIAVAIYHYSASAGKYQVLMRLSDGSVFGEDFSLDIMQGFFLKAAKAGNLTLSGRKVDRPSDQPVVKGFNMVTIPFGRHYPASVKTELTALELLKRLGPDGIAVYSYVGGVYRVVMRTGPGSRDGDFFAPSGDFQLEQGKGYFIKSGNSASFGTDM